ncbi:MAG: PDDEXK nuclease domain-containing protein [Prolixibacteraceae bacterium]|nr:PDDEXK nuclease domain-containing protein [Prolixibacteraceae bacterium]
MKQIEVNDFNQIVLLIEEAKNRAYQKVNEELVLLYFNVGKIVSLKVDSGVWGDNTVETLANFIETRYAGLKGFNRRGLYRMKQFYETYTAPEFMSPLVTQMEKSESEMLQFVTTLVTRISWTHHLLILSKTKTPEEKLFYIHQCINDKLSKRELERQLNSATFERTILASKKVSPTTSHLPQNLFKDPYIFEFLDLPTGFSERDLEKAFVLNLQEFILEIGKGFTYLGNQYRLQVGNKDYYTDLLFYHRDLQCLVLFELKIQEFEPEFLGKLNFYLEALDRNVKRPHENPSIGVLLCKGKDIEVVEYAMARNTSPAMIADYETKLIPKNILANKLHQLVEQLSSRED